MGIDYITSTKRQQMMLLKVLGNAVTNGYIIDTDDTSRLMGESLNVRYPKGISKTFDIVIAYKISRALDKFRETIEPGIELKYKWLHIMIQ